MTQMQPGAGEPAPASANPDPSPIPDAPSARGPASKSGGWRSSEAPWLVAAFLLICVLTFLRIYPVEKQILVLHDHLDGNLSRYVILAKLPLIGHLDDVVPQLFNGIPRNCLPSSLTFYSLLFRLVPAPTAILINEFVMRLAAFLGMSLLLRRHLLPHLHPFFNVGLALSFALLPFWPAGCLSIAGQPILLGALFDLREGRRLARSFLLVALFPFFSLLVMIGWVLVLVFFVFALEMLVRNPRRLPIMALATALLIASYSLVEYRLLYQQIFDADYVSHRSSFTSEWYGNDYSTIYGSYAWHLFSTVIWKGFFHALPLQNPFLILTLMGSFALLFVRLRKIRKAHGADVPDNAEAMRLRWELRLLMGCVVVILLGAAGYVFQQHPFLKSELLDRLPGPVSTLNFRRIGWLVPTAWYVGFAACLSLLSHSGRLFRYLAVILLVAQCIRTGEVRLYDFKPGQLTYEEFFSPELFNQITRFIGRPQSEYRVGSLGILPSIAQYNGFYTIDGYMPDYPLEYKAQFRRVIERSLEKDAELRTGYDHWGSKCYLFTDNFRGKRQLSNQALINTKPGRRKRISGTSLNIEALVDLDTEYLLSAYIIKQSEKLGLKRVRKFTHADSPWTIYLYRTPIGEVTEGTRQRIRRQAKTRPGSGKAAPAVVDPANSAEPELPDSSVDVPSSPRPPEED